MSYISETHVTVSDASSTWTHTLDLTINIRPLRLRQTPKSQVEYL